METAAVALLAQVNLTLTDVWLPLTTTLQPPTSATGYWCQCATSPNWPTSRPCPETAHAWTSTAPSSRRPTLPHSKKAERVTLHHVTTFGGWRQDEGRVLRKGHRQEHGHLIPYVTILAKGKRKLGWEIRAGDYAAIVPLENSHGAK